jgi:hypothetical protein
MMKIQKTISLDETTAQIAETIPNFSEWVRARLLDREEKESKVKHWLQCDLNTEHLWMSFNYDRIWSKHGSMCTACMKQARWDVNLPMGTLGAYTTTEDVDECEDAF